MTAPSVVRGPHLRSSSVRLLGPTNIGRLNRARVLRALWDNGALTRAELARMSAVTRATIGNVVQSLLDDGLIEEIANGEAVDGKAARAGRPLWFSSSGRCAVVTLSEGVVTTALVNPAGEVLRTNTERVSTRAAAATIVAIMAAGVSEMVTNEPGVLGVGVTVPGVCDADEGVVIKSLSAPGLNGFPLRSTLAAQFSLPFYLDNRSRTQAVAERLFGAGRGLARFACIDTFERLGVGLWFDGAGAGGAHGPAGEIGHTCVKVDGDLCECGLRGCWETVAATRWLRDQAARLGFDKPQTFDAARLVAGAGRGDTRHRALLEQYADNLSVGLASLAQVYTPEAFILNGDVLGGGETLRHELEKRTVARCLPHISDSIRVVFSDLGSRAALLGAAGLVLANEFQTAS